MVVVVTGLFFRSLSMVELDILCFFIRVYVVSWDCASVAQKGAYCIMKIPLFLIEVGAAVCDDISYPEYCKKTFYS